MSTTAKAAVILYGLADSVEQIAIETDKQRQREHANLVEWPAAAKEAWLRRIDRVRKHLSTLASTLEQSHAAAEARMDVLTVKVECENLENDTITHREPPERPGCYIV